MTASAPQAIALIDFVLMSCPPRCMEVGAYGDQDGMFVEVARYEENRGDGTYRPVLWGSTAVLADGSRVVVTAATESPWLSATGFPMGQGRIDILAFSHDDGFRLVRSIYAEDIHGTDGFAYCGQELAMSADGRTIAIICGFPRSTGAMAILRVENDGSWTGSAAPLSHRASRLTMTADGSRIAWVSDAYTPQAVVNVAAVNAAGTMEPWPHVPALDPRGPSSCVLTAALAPDGRLAVQTLFDCSPTSAILGNESDFFVEE